MLRLMNYGSRAIAPAMVSMLMASLMILDGGAAGASVSPVDASAALPTDPGCISALVPVEPLGDRQDMFGILCEPPGGHASTVMVLVPGATYNHTYWDFPYDPAVYNFREAMNRAGYATFTLDRLSTGSSTRPLSALLTSATEAEAVHDVITAVRSGGVGGVSFPKVILGGHSGGTAISIIEAATYHDADGVLLTGWTHDLDLPNLVKVFTTLYPAPLDRKFAGKGYDPVYLTTEPGTRAVDFYSPATIDPAVVAEDEATKDVEATTEVVDAFAVGAVSPYSARIKAPVLLVDGQNDFIVCGPLAGVCSSAAALKAQEAPYYAASPCLETALLPGAGHDVNLATDTQQYQRVVTGWADAFVGSGPGQVTPPRCS